MRMRFILILGACFVISFFMISCATTTDDHTQAISWDDVEQGIALSSNFNTLEVTTDIFSIYIELSEDELTHINFYSTAHEEVKDYFKIEVNEANDVLDIQIIGKKNITGTDILDLIQTWGAELHLQLPEHQYKKVAIASNVGKIEVNQIHVETLEATNDVGMIILRNTTGNVAKITNAVGAVKLHHVASKAEVKTNTGAVDMNVRDMVHDIDVKTELGVVTIEAASSPDNLKLDLTTDLGSIDTNLALDFDSKTRRTVKGQVGSQGATVKVNTVAGHISTNVIE